MKYVPIEKIKEKSNEITIKGSNRNLIEDLINHLNKLKPQLEIANKEKFNEPDNIEKIKKLKILLKKKAMFIKQLIILIKKENNFSFEIKWSNHLNKLILIFRENKEVIHISHMHPIGIIYCSPNYEIAKLMNSYIGNQKIKTFYYEKIKKRYNK